MRFRLRTLMILATILPPLLAGAWFSWRRYEEEKQRLRYKELIYLIESTEAPSHWDANYWRMPESGAAK
jgi:hypothetical protein